MSDRGLRGSLARVAGPLRQRLFGGSSSYWKERYERGGSSGIGSYGPLAEYKANVLNDFVREQQVRSVIEFGCGDGNQLRLAEYPKYIGLDVAPAAIDRCIRLFDADASKAFMLYSPRQFTDPVGALRAELGLSLDVIYHLVEDEVFAKYMQDLFAASERFVIVYSSNAPIRDAAPHVRHRPFTQWVADNQPNWALTRTIENPHRGVTEGAIADFFVFERR